MNDKEQKLLEALKVFMEEHNVKLKYEPDMDGWGDYVLEGDGIYLEIRELAYVEPF